jgi:glycosyltransferase involved in cell wall biosynthesis
LRILFFDTAMVLRVYDCSNSAARPSHRGGGGPLRNDVMRQLRDNADAFDARFVDNLADAQVLITNDVFFQEALQTGLPRVKRMDGVFFQKSLQQRNALLNAAALQANHVVFISNFSQRAYFDLYGAPLAAHSVILNRANPAECGRVGVRRSAMPSNYVAVATDWGRAEKRLDAVLTVARHIRGTLHLVGTLAPDVPLPANVKAHGYLTDPLAVAHVYALCDAMVCMSYRDAAPKTVAQGLAAGLPVLYAASGGVPELVGESGVAVKETEGSGFEATIPALAETEIVAALTRFEAGYCACLSVLSARDHEAEFQTMLAGYFSVLRAGATTPPGHRTTIDRGAAQQISREVPSPP